MQNRNLPKSTTAGRGETDRGISSKSFFEKIGGDNSRPTRSNTQTSDSGKPQTFRKFLTQKP